MPSIKKNYVMQLFYQLVKYVMPLVTMHYLSRVLEADGIGMYSFSHSIVTYFVLAVGLGTGGYGVKEIAQCRTNRELFSKTFWGIQIITFFTGALCIILWSGFCSNHSEAQPLFWALTPFILGAILDISWFFIGLEDIRNLVIVNSMAKVVETALVFTFVRTKADLVPYAWIMSCSTMLANCAMWGFLPRMLVRVSVRGLPYGTHLRQTLVFFIPSIATSIYKVLDKTLIGLILPGGFESGYYEQATKITTFAETASFLSFNSVMMPRMAFLYNHGQKLEYQRSFAWALDFAMALSIAVSVGLACVANHLVPVFLGTKFDPTVRVLISLAPVIPIIAVSNCLGSLYYTPTGRRAQSARYIVAGACVNLFLDLIMIPWLGVTGATMATVLSESVITVLYIRGSGPLLTFSKLWGCIRKRLTAAAVMALPVLWVGTIPYPSKVLLLVFQCIIGAVIYAGTLFVLHDPLALRIRDDLLRIRRSDL